MLIVFKGSGMEEGKQTEEFVLYAPCGIPAFAPYSDGGG